MRTLLSSTLLMCAMGAWGQTTLYFEDFETGGTSFNLNTADEGGASGTSGYNEWVINNDYTGGSGSLICMGFPFSFTVSNTNAQPAAITNQNGNYLHIVSEDAVAGGINCSSYRPADGFCTFDESNFSAMNSDISTVGLSSVTLTFWWGCGGNTEGYGEIYYSTDGGTSWTLLTVPITQYFNQSTWTQQTITDAAFDNQSQLRFGFRFVNLTTAGTPTEPAFMLDDIEVTGMPGCSNTTASITEVSCDSYTVPSGDETHTSSGIYMDTIPNVAGCDSILTIDLTINASPSPAPAGPLAYCQGGMVTLDAGAGYTTYAWSNGSTTQTDVFTTADNPITVTVTDANGCTGSSGAITLSENMPPQLGGFSIVDEVNGNDGSISVNITGGASPYTYAWSTSGTSDSIGGLVGGTYSLTVTDQNGCTFDTTFVVGSSVGLEEWSQQGFTLYPNPASESVAIAGLVAGQTWEVTDVWGRVVAQGAEPVIQLGGLTEGTYLVRVGSEVRPLVKY